MADDAQPGPPAAVVDPAVRRGSRLLGVLIVAVTLVFLGLDGALLLTVPDYQPPWYGYLFFAGTYWLNRRGHYRLAGGIITAMFPLVGFAHVASGNAADPTATLGYVALSPMVGMILLTPPGLYVLSGFNVVGVVVLPMLAPDVLGYDQIAGSVTMNVISAVLAITHVHFRNRVERDRRAAMLAEEDRRRAAFKAAGMGVWEWWVPERRMQVSPEVRELLGRSEPEWGNVPGDYYDAIHPGDRERSSRAYSALIHGDRESVAMEHRVVLPDGTIRWTQVHGRALQRVGGKAVRISGTIMNVTELRELERQLRQAQKLDAVGRLAGGVAHDLNNLLTVITGNVTLLQDVRDAPELREIDHAAASAAGLTRRLLAFGRTEPLAVAVVDVPAAVTEAVKMIERMIGEDVTLRTEVEGTNLHALLDPDELQQGLLNLATNARDAMPGGGEIHIRTRAVTLEGTEAEGLGLEPGPYVEVAVADTGVGMDESLSARVLEPFFSTKTPDRGTGLGLAMVLGTVKRARGGLRIESREGQGTTVHLYLPWSEQPVAGARGAGTPAPSAGPERILLVEDSEAVRKTAARILTRAGYQVDAFASPADVLEIDDATLRGYAMVLSDVVMPGMNGPELVARLKARSPRLGVLLMTGHSPETLDGPVLAKPFAGRDLLFAVRGVLDGAPQATAANAP